MKWNRIYNKSIVCRNCFINNSKANMIRQQSKVKNVRLGGYKKERKRE